MVTQRDIADKLGVSVALVSRVITGTASDIGVPEATIERVRATAEEMGYVPNLNARALRSGTSLTLGVAVTTFNDPFLGPILGELDQLAAEQGWSLVIEGLRDGAALPPGSALIKHRVDALIVAGHVQELDWLTPFRKRKVPVAALGHVPEHPGVQVCWIDEKKGFAQLLDHLAANGARRIGFIGGDQPLHRARAEQVHQLVDAHPTLSTRPEWTAFSTGRGMEAGYQALKQLWAEPEHPDSVISASDLRAIGALRAAAEHGLKVPNDLRITGFDDLDWAAYAQPALTTVRVPRLELVRAAFACVIDHAPPPAPIIPTLQVRESA